MGLYHTGNVMGTLAATTTSSKTQVGITARTASLRRHAIVEIVIGPDGAPNGTDGSMMWTVERCTTVGTGTTVTANPLNPADAACDALSTVMHSIEGTVSGSYASALLSMPINQRASQRWVAAPGAELIIPATDVAGIVTRCKGAPLISVGCSVVHNDL